MVGDQNLSSKSVFFWITQFLRTLAKDPLAGAWLPKETQQQLTGGECGLGLRERHRKRDVLVGQQDPARAVEREPHVCGVGCEAS